MELLKHKVDQLKKYDDALSKHLCEEHAQEFDEWWDPDKFDWQNYGYLLTLCCSEHFDKWWDPDKFDWQDYSYILPEYYSQYFDKWWNPNRFNWKQNWALAQYCAEYFDKWWDPDKFDWENCVAELIRYCSQYFDKWWDPNKITDKISIDNDILYALCQYASEYIERWITIIGDLSRVQLHIILTTAKIEYVEKHWDTIVKHVNSGTLEEVKCNLKQLQLNKLLLLLF